MIQVLSLLFALAASCACGFASRVAVTGDNLKPLIARTNETTVVVLYDSRDEAWVNLYDGVVSSMSEQLGNMPGLVVATGDVAASPALRKQLAPSSLPHFRVYPANIPSPLPVILTTDEAKTGENYAADVMSVLTLVDPSHNDLGSIHTDMYHAMMEANHMHELAAAEFAAHDADAELQKGAPDLDHADVGPEGDPAAEEEEEEEEGMPEPEAPEQIAPDADPSEEDDHSKWAPDEHQNPEPDEQLEEEPEAPPLDTDEKVGPAEGEEVDAPPEVEGELSEEEQAKLVQHLDDHHEQLPEGAEGYDPDRDGEKPVHPEGEDNGEDAPRPEAVEAELEAARRAEEMKADAPTHAEMAAKATKHLRSLRNRAASEAMMLRLRAHRLEFAAELAEKLESHGLELLSHEINDKTKELLSLPTARNAAVDEKRGRLMVEVSTLHDLISYSQRVEAEHAAGHPEGAPEADGEIPTEVPEDEEYVETQRKAHEEMLKREQEEAERNADL